MTDAAAKTDTDTPQANAAAAAKTAAGKASNLWAELGPVVAFVLAYNVIRRFPEGDGLFAKETAIYWATGVFMAALAGAIGWSLSKGRKIPPMVWVTAVVVGVFGTMTIALQDPRFAYYKPTIINLLFASVILGGLAVGRNVWKMMFRHVFDLPDFAWRVLAIRWGLFYIFQAGVNEFMWRSFSEEVWANSKIFLTMPLFVLFMLANTPYMMKHLRDDGDGEAAAKA